MRMESLVCTVHHIVKNYFMEIYYNDIPATFQQRFLSKDTLLMFHLRAPTNASVEFTQTENIG